LGAHLHGPTPSSVDLEVATSSHYDLLGSILGWYIYNNNKKNLLIKIFSFSFSLEEID